MNSKIRTVVEIAKAELKELFYSPIAWVLLVVLAIQTALSFNDSLESLVRAVEMNRTPRSATDSLFMSTPKGLLITIIQSIGFYIPLITMGLISREFNSGSIKLLYSSPITNLQIVMGKFCAMMVYSLALIGVLLIYLLFTVTVVDNLDIPYILSGLFGLFLLMCTYAAIGIFMSSLTNYQILAAIYTFTIFSLLNMVGSLGQGTPFLRTITYWLSLRGRVGEFVRGLICTEDILYFVSIAAFFIALTVIRLNAERQKLPFRAIFKRFSIALGALIVIAFITTNAKFTYYWDTTHRQINTLVQDSRDVLSRIDGELTITSYVNYLDTDAGFGLPEQFMSTHDRFRKYTRFKPDIKFEFVYYYDEILGVSLSEEDKAKTLEQRVFDKAKFFERDTSVFLKPSEIKKIRDLSSESNRFHYVMTTEDGKESILRIFDDNRRIPDEEQITASLKQLVDSLPKVGVVSGYGTRNINGKRGSDCSNLFTNRRVRGSLINNGFTIENVDLETGANIDNVNLLIILDPSEVLSDKANENLTKYINSGRDLFITTDVENREGGKALLSHFGVGVKDGIVANILEDNDYNLTFSYLSKSAIPKEINDLQTLISYNYPVIFNGALALNIVAENDYGFKADTLMSSSPRSSWLELQTTNFVDEVAEMDAKTGESRGPKILALYLSREVNGRNQRVMIFGDTDFVSNNEVSIKRKVLSNMNYTLIKGFFRWLSNNEAPVEVRYTASKDRNMSLRLEGLIIVEKIFLYGIPLIFMLSYLLINVRRRNR